jgi:hypothetical protein
VIQQRFAFVQAAHSEVFGGSDAIGRAQQIVGNQHVLPWKFPTIAGSERLSSMDLGCLIKEKCVLEVLPPHAVLRKLFHHSSYVG